MLLESTDDQRGRGSEEEGARRERGRGSEELSAGEGEGEGGTGIGTGRGRSRGRARASASASAWAVRGGTERDDGEGEGGREGWMDGWMDGGREGGRQAGRQGGREAGRKCRSRMTPPPRALRVRPYPRACPLSESQWECRASTLALLLLSEITARSGPRPAAARRQGEGGASWRVPRFAARVCSESK